MLGLTEALLILAVVLILFGIKNNSSWNLHRRSHDSRFKRARRDLLDELGRDPRLRHHSNLSAPLNPAEQPPRPPTSVTGWLVVWLAQGFGIGRVPWAPGTFGSLLGLGWFALLLWIAQWSVPVAVAVFLASIIASVWTCDGAEILLGQKDPGSIVLDEIVALPTCFLGWIFYLWLQLDAMPPVEFFFGPTTWFLAAGVFLAFRFFDIVKPWPVKQSQDVPNGWGVMLDDQLAAVYVNLVVLGIHIALQMLGKGA